MDMDTNTLIAAVVRGVVEQLGPGLGRQPEAVAEVLAPADAKLAREVATRLGNTMRVRFQGEEAPEPPALHVLPELSCSDMADLAQGRGSSIAMRGVLDLLLQGRPVRTLGFAFRRHMETAPHALLQLYEDYAAKLASYGLTELAPAAPEAFSVRETLVTAEHVTTAIAEGARSLRVPYRAVVTPLAQQTAADHNLTILNNL